MGDPISTAAEKATKMCGGELREQTRQARGWASDCWYRMPDGRLTETLGMAETWFLVERNYEGGISAFLADGGVAV